MRGARAHALLSVTSTRPLRLRLPAFLACLCLLAEGGAPDGAPDNRRETSAQGSQELPDHLREAREKVITKPTSLDEAREHLGNALRAAWGIGAHFGHVWRGVQSLGDLRAAPLPRPQSRRAEKGSAKEAGVVNPVDFGADPTGAADSTAALKQALAELISRGKAHSGATAANGIVDLGGMAMDLNGGTYLISEPLAVPTLVGNLRLHGGTLRASERFPSGQFILSVGSPGCANSGPDAEDGHCNQFVDVTDMLFDAGHVAAGGVHVAHTMGSNIGPSVFFSGFKEAGVRVDGGHGVTIQEAWLSEYYWSDGKAPGGRAPDGHASSSSIGVQLNGRGHTLLNVVIFKYAKIGVEVNGARNLLQNVHTWNGGGTGIAVNAPQTRILGCYLDWNKLVITDPEQTLVQSTMFLETNVQLKAVNKDRVEGLRLHGNTYAHPGVWKKQISSVELLGTFEGGTLDIKDETSLRVDLKQTRASRTLRLQDATRWVLDFSDVLLLPRIDEVMYSFASEGGGFVNHVARRPVGTTVTVETDAPITATVTVEVSQGSQKFGKKDDGQLPQPEPSTSSTSSCMDAAEGSKCAGQVKWAMKTGIAEHPEWYPGLTCESSRRDFQLHFHRSNLGDCPEPCLAEAGRTAEAGCHDTVDGERCFSEVTWARLTGIAEHAEWFSGLSPDSSPQEFQLHLHNIGGHCCPKPCGVAA